MKQDETQGICPLVRARLLRARVYELVAYSAKLKFQNSFQIQLQNILDLAEDEEWVLFYKKKLATIEEMYDYLGKPEKAVSQNDWAFLGYIRKTSHQLFEQILEQYPHDQS